MIDVKKMFKYYLNYTRIFLVKMILTFINNPPLSVETL